MPTKRCFIPIREMLGKKQLQGLFRKTYSLVLDIPYEKVGKIVNKGRYKLELTEVGGKKHDFTSPDTPISIITNSLKDLNKSVNTGKDD